MLKVCPASIACNGILTFGKGNEGGRPCVDRQYSYTIVHSIVLNRGELCIFLQFNQSR
jgi:hypothetical protein